MSHKQTAIAGVLPVLSTPFHTDESIDFSVLEKEIDWVYEQGADGVVTGMVSETLRLSTDERKELAAAICELNHSRGPSIISVGAESTYVAVELARHAASVGASAVMVIPPTTVALGESQVVAYYEAIIHAVQVPVIIQDASAYVGRPMSIELQADLFNRYPDRIIFKPEANPLGPRLSALRDATGGRAPVLEGTGGMALVDNFRRGIVGTMPGADMIDALVALWHALQAGDEEQIYAISLPISAIIAIQTSLDAFVAVEKHLLCKRGIFRNSVVRQPVGYTLDLETEAELERLFGRLLSAIPTT